VNPTLRTASGLRAGSRVVLLAAALLALLPRTGAASGATDGKHPADVNAREVDGTTPLHWAAREDNVEEVRRLLRAGARPDVANRYGVTPLALAAANGNAAILDLLIAAGADPNAASVQSEPVLMSATRSGNIEAVRCLLGHGANVNAREAWQGETALMWAAGGNHAAILKLLLEHGADINARSGVPDFPRKQAGLTVLPRGNWTPLMYAARQGALDTARALADAGANLDLTDPDGTTALVLAIINVHYDTAAVLIEAGANPNLADDTGMAALYAAADMNTLPWMFGRPDPKLTDKLTGADIVAMLLDYGADPNARLKAVIMQRHHTGGDFALGEGSTAFMRAAKSGDLPVMRMLLAYGADPTITQKNHTTALMLAAGFGWRDGNAAIPTRDRGSVKDALAAMQICLDGGVNVRAANDAGDTVLHAAATRGSDVIIQFLVDKGADVHAKNRQGRTPLDAALARRGASAVPAAVAIFQKLSGVSSGTPAPPAAPAQAPPAPE
jgi:ankyrin repeat protein